MVVADTNASAAADVVGALPRSHDQQQHFAVAGNVASEQDVLTMFDAVDKRFGRLNIAVNSAGITRDGRFLNMSVKDFDDVVGVNLRGTFLVAQRAAALMIKAGVTNGSIINISSIVAKTGNFGQTNYSAAKGGRTRH